MVVRRATRRVPCSIRGAPVSARVSPVARSTTRSSVRFRSLRVRKREGDVLPSGETARAALVADRVARRVADEPLRPRIVDRPRPRAGRTRRARRSRSASRRPTRRVLPASTSFLGGPPVAGDHPHLALVGVGDLRAVGRERGCRVLPVRHRLHDRSSAAPPCASRARRIQTSDVSRSEMKTTRGRRPRSTVCAVARDAQIASSRQCGGCGLLAPVGVGTPPYSSVPTQRRSGSLTRSPGSLLDPLERGDHEPAERCEIVATFLHDHSRQFEARRAARRQRDSRPRDVQRAVRIAGRGVDAERDDEGVGAELAHALAALRPRRASPRPRYPAREGD